jgi:hypothetical protein
MPVCATGSADAEAKPQARATIQGLTLECTQRSKDSKSPTYAPDYYAIKHGGRQWQVIGRNREGSAVAAERQTGSGSIVLVSDSYTFTNEALLRARNTELLTRVLGDSRIVVFDEHHLGIAESRGVVSLARQYRLHGFAAGLLLIAVLFIWRNSSSFLPRIPDQQGDYEVPGRAAASGLTNLLGRAIPPADLMSVCAAEWKRSKGSRIPEQQVSKVLQIAGSARAGNHPAAAYREIAQLLNERRRR